MRLKTEKTDTTRTVFAIPQKKLGRRRPLAWTHPADAVYSRRPCGRPRVRRGALRRGLARLVKNCSGVSTVTSASPADDSLRRISRASIKRWMICVAFSDSGVRSAGSDEKSQTWSDSDCSLPIQWKQR